MTCGCDHNEWCETCCPPRPKSITFQCGDTWALKITKDGITSNPDVPIDDGAKAMIAELGPYIRQLMGSL
jgi:hypothetical protein